jgi:hypothetical protein
MKGESVDRACTTALVFRMAREERRHAIFPGRRGATIAEAERFAREAEMARTGRLPEPKPADGSAMTKTRARLLSALASPAKERSPVFASLAFARYDAWDERQRAWPNGEEAQGFRRDVEETLTVLEGLCAQGG